MKAKGVRRAASSVPPDDPVTAYARSVVHGQRLAGRLVRLACQRHLDDVEHQEARGLLWQPDRVTHVLEFFRDFLVLPDGPHAGEPFVLQDFQVFVVGSLHGWFRRRDGRRRFQFGFVLTAKGQSKTPLGAGLAVYAAVAEEQRGAQCFVAARTRSQAADSFRDVGRILGPRLRARLEVLTHNVSDPETGSFIRPVSSEARTLEGNRVYFALLDEVALHKNAEVVKSMQRGTKGNTEALILAITNAGEDRESIAWEFQDKAMKVLEGILRDDEYFAYVCTLDPCARCAEAGHREPQPGCEACDDWRDEGVWLKTSPMLGVTIDWDYVRKEVKGAIDLPSTESSVKRFNFCSWVAVESRWMSADAWGACGIAAVRDLRGRPAVLGIDLAQTRDLAAAVLIVPDDDFFAEIQTDAEGHAKIERLTGALDVVCWAWCPEAMVLEQARRGIPYDAWVRAGALIATPGNVIDHAAIRRHIVGLRDQGYWVQEIAYDPAFAVQFAQPLQDEHGFTVTPIAQDYKTMTAPCQLLETLVMTQRLRHANTPVLRFCASNVVLERDSGGRMRPSKKKSEPHGKIDAITALLTGLKQLDTLRGLGVVGVSEAVIGPARAQAPW